MSDEHHDEFSKAFNYFQKEFANSEEAALHWRRAGVCYRWANMAVNDANMAVYTGSDYNWDYVSNAQTAHPQARDAVFTYYFWIHPEGELIQNMDGNMDNCEALEQSELVKFFKRELSPFRVTEYGFLGYIRNDFIHCTRGVLCTNVIYCNVVGKRAECIMQRYLKQNVCDKKHHNHLIMAIAKIPHKKTSWHCSYNNDSFKIIQTTGVATLHRWTISDRQHSDEDEEYHDKNEFCSDSDFDEPSTYFELKKNGTILARCLMTYYHEEFSEFGPCIEMISADPNHRGQQHAKALNREVENFVRKIGYPPSEDGVIRMYCYKIEGGV